MKFTKLTILLLVVLATTTVMAQEISINLNVKHQVEGISTFDRKKYINVHASLTDNDWKGQYDKMDYLIGELDVYMGRDNGSLGWNINQSTQDPNRPGYVDSTYIVSKGKYYRETVYGKQRTETHKHDSHADVLVGGQTHTFWAGQKTSPYNNPDGGWMIGGPNAENAADAGGEFMGRFFRAYYRNQGEPVTKGKPRPRFMEILNEPLYELIDGKEQSTVTPTEVFQYHNDVADAIRRHSPDIMIGGYTAAFPVFEENNFQRWHNRHKLFYDMSGDKMDFISLHFYDHHRHHLADDNASTFDGPWYYSGGRLEATFDMLDQYSMMKFDSIKPYLISEFAGKDHATSWKTWTPQRDWYIMKSITPMMLQFMKRPNNILKTIPFLVLKAEWGRTNVPYNPRLMIQNFEKEGETGDHWVWSNLIKFYELWSDVKGTRVDVRSSHYRVMTDAYVDGNKVYVIAYNMVRGRTRIALDLFETKGNTLESVKVKQLHMPQNEPVLETNDLKLSNTTIFYLNPEATAIFEYTFAQDIEIDQTTDEKHYYADKYLQEISAQSAITFTIDGVELKNNTDGVLRIGMGRDHDKSKTPTITFNGTTLSQNRNYSSDDQHLRPQFFGMIEANVPGRLLQEKNTITVTFPDNGGHVSSVTMCVLNSTAKVDNPMGIAQQYNNQDFKVYPNPGNGLLTIELGNNKRGTIKVLNLSGQEVYTASINNSTSLNISHLDTGIYILSAWGDDWRSTKRLVLR